MASWENKLYNFLYRLCCTDLIAFTRKFNWVNLLIHCLPGSNIVTLDSKRLFTIVALWLIFSCVVLEHTAAFFPRKRFKRHHKNSRHRKHHLLLKEMVDFASRHGYVVCLFHYWRNVFCQRKELLWGSLSSFNDAWSRSSPRSSYRSSPVFFLSIFFLFSFIFIIIIIIEYTQIDILAINHPSFVIP